MRILTALVQRRVTLRLLLLTIRSVVPHSESVDVVSIYSYFRASKLRATLTRNKYVFILFTLNDDDDDDISLGLHYIYATCCPFHQHPSKLQDLSRQPERRSLPLSVMSLDTLVYCTLSVNRGAHLY